MPPLDARLGSPFGNHRVGTILKVNPTQGTVEVGLDEVSLSQPRQKFTIPIPAPWIGTDGEFLGGYPRVGTSVKLSQGQGGEWFILGYKANPQIFSDSTVFGNLKPGRILAQVKGGNNLFLDPKIGFKVGQDDVYLHADPIREIISNNFSDQWEFSSSIRKITGIIKRDLANSSASASNSSFLEEHRYEDSLFKIGLDPTVAVSQETIGGAIRNPALVESKEIVYEFDPSYQVSSYSEESSRYGDPALLPSVLRNSRRENRTDAFSLSPEFPNHLMETIRGTGTDVFGNILDLNRNPLPIGKISEISLKDSVNKSVAYQNITEQFRKSLAYHWEINSRKPFENSDLSTPDITQNVNYGKNSSRFFIDIDKESQIKANFPASSETGNIALLTRYENYSVLKSKEDSSINPNSLVKPNDSKDIYLGNFSSYPVVKLAGSDQDLDGYASPVDRFSDSLIRLGTAYHDISKTCQEFQESANYIQAGLKLVNFDQTSRLNSIYKPLPKIVSDTIIVNGPDANAGGRSATLNFDGMVSLNFGANTIDRQSLWVDCAGGVVARYGRDKQGISYAAQMDGDVLIEVGGVGLPSSQDSRFSDQNSGWRNGTFEMRININGQLGILRFGPEGLFLISPGGITLDAQQDIILKSNSSVFIDGEKVTFYPGTADRSVARYPAGKTF